MPNIINSNSITPKKKPIRNWGYSKVNGGDIYKFSFPETEGAIERMRQEVDNINRWERYPGPNPHGRGDRNYTIIRIIPNFDILKVHSLYFPDGTVWDSSIRDFRPIRDYELTD